MSKATINESSTLEIPDSFSPMDAGELRKLFRNDDPDRWGTWDRENHVMITVMWKDYPKLLARFADLKTVCRKNEQLSGKGYAGHEYRCGGFFSTAAGELPAEGYSFSYQIGDISQSAETVLFKQGRTIYSMTCAGRAENRAADHETFAGILKGVRPE